MTINTTSKLYTNQKHQQSNNLLHQFINSAKNPPIQSLTPPHLTIIIKLKQRKLYKSKPKLSENTKKNTHYSNDIKP